MAEYADAFHLDIHHVCKGHSVSVKNIEQTLNPQIISQEPAVAPNPGLSFVTQQLLDLWRPLQIRTHHDSHFHLLT